MGNSLLKSLLVIAGASALMVSCNKGDFDYEEAWKKSVVDPEYNDYFESSFGKIDSDQDFKMVEQREMTITNVGGDVNTTYTIYLCQGNPNSDKNAMALYQTTAQGQSSVSFKVDLPMDIEELWVVRSAQDDQIASFLTLDNTTDAITFSFEEDETRAQVSEQTVSSYTDSFNFDFVNSTIEGHTYTMSVPSTTLNDQYYDGNQGLSGNEFRIAAGTYSNLKLYNYSVSQIVNGDWSTIPACKLYVDGNVTINASCLFYYADFYVPSGSTLTFNGADGSQSISFHVKKGGKLILNDNYLSSMSAAYPATIANEGEVVINGKSASEPREIKTTTTGSVTFKLNDRANYQATTNTIVEGLSSTAVNIGNSLSLNDKSNVSVNGFSEKFVGFQPKNKISANFNGNIVNGDVMPRFDYTVEMAVMMENGYTFKPTRLTGNVARVGTDNGKLDLIVSDGYKWSPTILASGLIPRRNDKTQEEDKYGSNENYTVSFDLQNEWIESQNFSLYAYIYDLATEKQIALNNVVLSGTVTKTTWESVTSDPTFSMGNYCNFFNAGRVKINCPMTFNPADGNSDYNYFINYGDAILTGDSVFIGGKGAQFANAGDMTLSRGLTLASGSGGNAQALNKGNLHIANLNLHSGVCHFYNGGTTIVDGLTVSTQRGNTWVNNGYYKTKTLRMNAGNNSFYNYCRLIATDTLYVHDATFNNMPSSYAQAAYIDLGNFTCNLNEESVMFATNLLFIADGKGAGLDNGFHGLGRNSLIAARQMDVMAASSCNIQFLENIYYSYGRFRYVDENGNELTKEQADARAADGDKRIFAADASAKNVAYSELSIKAPEDGECSATWNHGGGEEPQPFAYMLAYEDLGSKDDFDFNDIVLKVTHTGGTTEGKVQLMAAGGTLKIKIFFDGQELFNHNDGKMYATGGSEGNASMDNCAISPKIKTITMDDNFSWTDDNCLKKFTLHVTNAGGDFANAISATGTPGFAPQCLVIPSGEWRWPTGRTNIKLAYPQIQGWITNKNSNLDWYKYPETGYVY